MLLCDRHPRSIVHQNEIGPNRSGKCDRGTLTLIESSFVKAVVGLWIGPDCKPRRSLPDPRSHLFWSLGVNKLSVYRCGYKNSLEELWENSDRVDKD